MKKIACRYSIIRFLPYRETGEFANVGIALICPEMGYFDFKILTRRYGRITSFFDEIDGQIYSRAINLFKDELERIKIQFAGSSPSPDTLRSLFDSLVHPREAILQFDEVRSRLIENESPKATLDKLFGHYVERDFASLERKEADLVKRVKGIVNSLKLKHPFKTRDLGDEFASANFPLVQSIENQGPIKVIKPFMLNQSEPKQIISHGGIWVDRIKRMQNRRTIPKSVLFAIEGPTDGSGNRQLACDEICEDLRKLHIEVVSTVDQAKIIAFAES